MAVQTRRVQAAISENRTWFITLGILLIILGVAAIAFPLLTTIAAKIALGCLFLIGGVVQIAPAFSTPPMERVLFRSSSGPALSNRGRLAGALSTNWHSDAYGALGSPLYSSRCP